MAYSQSDLDAVRAALAKGERSVQFADRSVVYRSTDELLAAEARISKALEAAAAASSRRARQSIAVGTKGF